MNLINLKENTCFIEEYILICLRQWGNFSKYSNPSELSNYIRNKKEQILKKDSNHLLIIGLIDDSNLIGFISLFKNDSEEEKHLTPWYSTLYIHKKYRNNGYSKLLHNAIIINSKKLGYDKLYLKTSLTNYYEKYEAIYIKDLSQTEKLYCINI